MQLAAIAPTAMASSVALASRRGQLAGERRGGVIGSGRADGDRGRPDDLQDHAGQEQPQRREQPGAGGRHRGGQVAGVVGGVRGPARGVAERGADGQQEAAQAADAVGNGRRAQVRLAQDHHRGDREDDREQRKGPAFEGLHQVVAEEREHGLDQHDDDQREQRADVEQGRERERPADAVCGEPADTGGDRHQHRRHGVALEPECQAAQHHLRHPVQRAACRQDVVRDRAQPGTDHDAGHRLPEVHSVDRHREYADEDRRELEVGRGPRPEQLARMAVPVLVGDELVSAGFDGDQFVAVGAVGLHARFGRVSHCHGLKVVPDGPLRNRRTQLVELRRLRASPLQLEEVRVGQRRSPRRPTACRPPRRAESATAPGRRTPRR